MRRHRGNFTPHSGRIAKALADLGQEVTVLAALLCGGGGAVEVEDGGMVRHLADTPPTKGGGSFWPNSADALDRLHAERPVDFDFGRLKAVWRLLRYSRHAETIAANLHEGTCPVLLHQIETPQGWVGHPLGLALAPIFALKKRATRSCMRRVARVVCTTPQLAQALWRAYWWYPPRTVALTYGLDAPRYQSAPPVHPLRLISIGRSAWGKGILPMPDPALLCRMGDAARRKIKTDFAPTGKNARWQELLTKVAVEATSGQRG